MSYVLPPLPWTSGEVASEYRQWVLSAGFRDLAEETALFLEGVREVAALFKLMEKQGRAGQITGEEWNTEAKVLSERFHKLGLPDKLVSLKNDYSVEILSEFLEQARSINRARNCLAHRGGIAGTPDLDSSGALRIKWRRLAIIVRNGTEEHEVTLPYSTKQGDEMILRWLLQERAFAAGDRFDLTAEEFSEVAWAVTTFGMGVAESLEARGKAIGLKFASPEAPAASPTRVPKPALPE